VFRPVRLSNRSHFPISPRLDEKPTAPTP